MVRRLDRKDYRRGKANFAIALAISTAVGPFGMVTLRISPPFFAYKSAEPSKSGLTNASFPNSGNDTGCWPPFLFFQKLRSPSCKLMLIQVGALTGAYSQETSPDAISPRFRAPLSRPAICSSSVAVMSLQGSGMAASNGFSASRSNPVNDDLVI